MELLQTVPCWFGLNPFSVMTLSILRMAGNIYSGGAITGSAGIQQTLTATWMPHLTGTHASSDELSSFSLPAMFDFLDEVGNLPC